MSEEHAFDDIDVREAPRLEDTFHVILIGESGNGSEPCELLNISTGGMAINAPRNHRLLEGSSVLVELPLGRSQSGIRTRCKIRHVGAKSKKTVHLQFLDESKLFQRILSFSIQAWYGRKKTSGAES